MSPQVQYDYAGRVARARTMMRAQGIDGLYVVAGHNMRYFLGWTAFEYS